MLRTPPARTPGWAVGPRDPATNPRPSARLTVRPPRCQPGEREQRGFPGAQVGRRVSREFEKLATAGLDTVAPPFSGRGRLRFLPVWAAGRGRGVGPCFCAAPPFPGALLRGQGSWLLLFVVTRDSGDRDYDGVGPRWAGNSPGRRRGPQREVAFMAGSGVSKGGTVTV